MNQLERLIRIAYQTVSTHLKTSASGIPAISTPSQISSIIDAMKTLNAEEFNLHSSIQYLQSLKESSAPVTYIKILHNKWFSLGIFVIHAGHGIPKHDHKGMFGAIKVIHGEIRVSSYTVQEFKTQPNSSICTVVPDSPQILNSKSDPVYLTSRERKIHEIEYISSTSTVESESGTPVREYAAFIDFLCPPYDETKLEGSGPCHYFNLIFKYEGANSFLQFQKTSVPPTFWSNSAPFMGNPIASLVQEMESQYPNSQL